MWGFLIVLLGQCLAQSSDPQCPDVCPQYVYPVCGTNNKTYSNICFLNAAACREGYTFGYLRDGPCECDPTCTKEYRPICGTDNVTYGNQCMLDYETCRSNGEVQALHDGPCGECTDFCPEIFHPVCGTNNETYPNLCFLNVAACHANFTFGYDRDGPCECNSGCTKEFRPVCGTDNVTYSNLCLLEYQSCLFDETQYLHDGPCEECPPGSNVSECLVDPCSGKTCPIYPSAQCVPDYCDGCGYEFQTDTGAPITQCRLPRIRCNGRGVQCFADPCTVQSCPAYPGATCQANYCTGCDTIWYWEGKKVDCGVSCSTDYWKGVSLNSWPVYRPQQTFYSVFKGISYYVTLSTALRSSDQTTRKQLAAEAVTSLLNAASHFGYQYSPSEVIQLVRNAWPYSQRVRGLLNQLRDINSGVCPSDGS